MDSEDSSFDDPVLDGVFIYRRCSNLDSSVSLALFDFHVLAFFVVARPTDPPTVTSPHLTTTKNPSPKTPSPPSHPPLKVSPPKLLPLHRDGQ